MVTRNKKNRKLAGFSLLEFLAVMVLVAVLALIAIPIYDSYIKKARFQNVVVAVESFKPGVAACAQNLGIPENTSPFVGCNEGSNGIPAMLGETGPYVARVTVSSGIIIGVATKKGGLNSEIYALVPTMKSGGIITWAVDGGSSCLTAGLCDNPQ